MICCGHDGGGGTQKHAGVETMASVMSRHLGILRSHYSTAAVGFRGPVREVVAPIEGNGHVRNFGFYYACVHGMAERGPRSTRSAPPTWSQVEAWAGGGRGERPR